MLLLIRDQKNLVKCLSRNVFPGEGMVGCLSICPVLSLGLALQQFFVRQWTKAIVMDKEDCSLHVMKAPFLDCLDSSLSITN